MLRKSASHLALRPKGVRRFGVGNRQSDRKAEARRSARQQTALSKYLCCNLRQSTKLSLRGRFRVGLGGLRSPVAPLPVQFALQVSLDAAFPPLQRRFDRLSADATTDHRGDARSCNRGRGGGTSLVAANCHLRSLKSLHEFNRPTCCEEDQFFIRLISRQVVPAIALAVPWLTGPKRCRPVGAGVRLTTCGGEQMGSSEPDRPVVVAR